MLRKLTIRKKLALLLVAPVLALLVLTALGVQRSLSDSSATSDAEQRASMSARTGELFEAVRQEAARNQLAVFNEGDTMDMGDVRTATDLATTAWLTEVAPYQEADTSGLISYLQDFGAHRDQVIPQYGTDVDGAIDVSIADLAVLERIAAFDSRLAGDAEDVIAADLATAALLTDAGLSSARAEILGLQSATAGEITSVSLASDIDTADADLAAYTARTGQTIGSNALDEMNETLSVNIGDDVAVDPAAWLGAAEERALEIAGARATLSSSTSAFAASEASSAGSAMRNIALIGLGGMLLGGLAMLLIGSKMQTIMSDLTVEAAAVAQHDVPELAESLARGEAANSEAEERPFLEIEGDDEFAELGQSLNEIRRSTKAVAEEQGQLVQSGIAEMFVSLARRNQTLVDRQLEVIDELEAQEVDADRLAQVYRVDHLATRMRRNAESLLVLAGNNTPRKRGPAVDVREVVRVAIGEVEDYRRIIPISLDETPVAGHAAQDLAHLLSELMENATQSSPPGTVADVVGALEPDGSYSISVIDRGTGIDATKRAELNVLLAKPPKNTLSGSMTMGLTVVARLADRVGVAVQLLENESNGINARVTLPSDLVAEWGGGRPETPPEIPVFKSVTSGVPGSAPVGEAAPQAPTVDPNKPVFEPFDFTAGSDDEPAAPVAEPAAVDASVAGADVASLADTPSSGLDLPPIPELPSEPTDSLPPLGGVVDDNAVSFETDVPTLDSDVFEPMDVMEPFELPSLDPAALQMPDSSLDEALVEDAVPGSASPFDSLTPPEDAPVFDAPPPLDPVPSAPEVPAFPEAPVMDEAPAVDQAPAFPEAPVMDEAPVFDQAPAFPEAPVFDDAPAFPEAPVFDEAPAFPEAPVFDEAPSIDEAPVFPAAPAMDEAPAAFDPSEMPAPPIMDAPVPDAPSAPIPETTAPDPVAAATNGESTPGGLTRRRKSSAPTAAPPSLEADRTAPSKRSPDQVKSMLSRYKTGLEKGRSTEQDGGS